MWEGDLSFFLPAVPSALLLHISPIHQPKGHWPPSPPSPAEMSQRQLLLPPAPCLVAQPKMCHPEVSLCIKGRVLGRGRVGSSLGELCPGSGHPAMSPLAPRHHPDITQALGSSLPAPGCSWCPSSSAEPLFRLLSTRGAAAPQTLGWVSRAACSPSPSSSLALEKPSELQLLHQLLTTSTEAVAMGAAPFQGLIPEMNPYFRPNKPCLPPQPKHFLCHSPQKCSCSVKAAGNVSAHSGGVN